MKISARERKYLIPAIVYEWDIEKDGGGYYWDGDKLMPVKFGPLAESLISRGLLEKVKGTNRIRGALLLDKFQCQHCRPYAGKIYNDDGEVVGDCPECDGTGAVLEISN